jgi:quercetin dioxygenase-like cupin family protein
MQAFGDYTVIANHEFPECSLRLLRVEPGQEIPVHYHSTSSQSYLVIEGTVEVRVGEVRRRLDAGDAVRVPAGELHAVRPLEGAAVVLSASIPPLRPEDHFPAGSAGSTLS